MNGPVVTLVTLPSWMHKRVKRVVDCDHEGGIYETTAADEPGVGVHQTSDFVDHAKISPKDDIGWNGASTAARTPAQACGFGRSTLFRGVLSSLRLAA